MALRLEELETFLAVGDEEGFAAAGRRLGLSPSAVSKHVRSLEDSLGVRLFQRTTRSLSLTEAGRALRGRAPRLLEDARELEQELRGESARPRGVLRVSAPQDFARLQLCGAIGAFLRRHPELGLDLELADRQVDVVEEGFDVALRIAAPADSSLVRRRLAPCRTVLCAAPAYLASRGEPERPADLRRHVCLAYAYQGGWRLQHGGRLHVFHPASGFRSNSGFVLRELALAASGVVVLPTFLVGDDLRAGRLREVLPGALEQRLELAALYPHRRGLPAKVRAFVDFLAERFADGPVWDRGLPSHAGAG